MNICEAAKKALEEDKCIPYLEQYVDSLKEAGRKTVALEDKQ